MRVATLSFTILQFCGLWRPFAWSHGIKKNLYDAFTIFTTLLVFSCVLSELVQFLMFEDDFDEVINNSFMLLTMLGICYKFGNFVCKREQIFQLFEIFDNDVCRPDGVEETAIQLKFDEKIRNITRFCIGIVEIAVLLLIAGAFLDNIPQRTLPVKAWLPFDYKCELGFWIAFPHQLLGLTLASTVSACHDSILHRVMIETCAQLHILKYRLRTMSETIRAKKSELSIENSEREEVRNCVRHHQEIFELAKRSNDIFDIVIFTQFSVSTFVICVSTYMVSKASVGSIDFIFLIVYLACMIVQIFLMCWNGNEVLTESINVGTAVYEMHWASLRQSTKKDLQMIMARTSDSISYNGGHILTLSLDSYNSLMKLSYSIYNLLATSL